MPYPTCLLSVTEFLPFRAQYVRESRCVVFTNGCFDILHSGHVHLLEQARAAGDVLVVGLNSDRSVKLGKGDRRPIISEDERALLLCALKPVDHVILFDEPTPLELISLIKPDVLVKGSDWQADEIVGSDVVRQNGGRIIRIELRPGRSTTQIIETIRARFGSPSTG